MQSVRVTWQEGLHLKGDAPSGYSLPLDGGTAAGGQGRGFLPSELLLTALGGCTTMDIVSLLKKFHAPFTSCQVELAGQKHENHPKAFKTITAIYRIDGEITPEQAWKAVNSSYQKYSVVANSLCVAVDYQLILNGAKITGEK